MSNAIQHLAECRAALVTATENAEAAHGAQSKLLVRKSECEANAAAALADFRAGKIDEATASLRKASFDADAKDLSALIAQGAAHLQGLNVLVANRKHSANIADQAAKLEENSMALAEMQKLVLAAEENYLASVAELHRLYVSVNGKSLGNGTVWKCHQPTAEHRALVTSNAVPSLRG